MPVLLRLDTGQQVHTHSEHAQHMVAASVALPNTAMLAIGVHTVAMFAVMAVVAIVVFEKLGLRLLRRAWFNLDFLWTGALLLAGLLTLVAI